MADVAPANGAAKAAPVVTTGAAKTVPYERHQIVTAEKRELAARVAALEAEVQTATERAATADTLASQLEALKGEYKTKESGWAEERALLGAGVTDPEDVDLVRFHFGRLPKEGKPASVADFVSTLKADGATIPKGLGHLFGAKAAADTTTTTKPMPKNSAGDGKGAPATEALSHEAIKALRLEAVKTGDWTKVRAAMPQMDEAVRKKT